MEIYRGTVIQINPTRMEDWKPFDYAVKVRSSHGGSVRALVANTEDIPDLIVNQLYDLEIETRFSGPDVKIANQFIVRASPIRQ